MAASDRVRRAAPLLARPQRPAGRTGAARGDVRGAAAAHRPSDAVPLDHSVSHDVHAGSRARHQCHDTRPVRRRLRAAGDDSGVRGAAGAGALRGLAARVAGARRARVAGAARQVRRALRALTERRAAAPEGGAARRGLVALRNRERARVAACRQRAGGRAVQTCGGARAVSA